ncbi:MAG: non-homologous end-joining DNA ligase [Actinomycetes bacterium]
MADSSTAIEVEVAGRVVKVSNPQKPYFPALGEAGTKGALVGYYAQAATALLTAIRDRPTYLQRFPDGIEGEEVYQKRLPKHTPDWIDRCTITFPSGRSAEALCTDEPAAVVWAANYGTVTFHPWPSRCPDVEHPDRLRIDLDPQPGTDFSDARDVALEVLRPVLGELGYSGFVKTSGGRGVHVDVPIEPRWSILDVRRAALALAREMARRDPTRITAQWWKEDRGERVFVDYNQNARDRTIASAYSVRRTAIATVSTPVTWEELASVAPSDFTIATVPERLKTLGDLQEPMDTQAFSLEPLLDWVARDEAEGEGEAPFPPNYPKMPGEPTRVQPSRARPVTTGNDDTPA